MFQRLYQVWKQKFIGSEIFHMDQYPMISACILQTHLKAYGDDVTISSLSGEVLLPPYDKKIPRKDQVKLLKNSAPVMIYNAIYQSDMPASGQIVGIAKELERKLKENEQHPWVKLLMKAYLSDRMVDKRYLLDLPANEAAELGITRNSFDDLCGNLLIEVVNNCIKERESLFLWMNKHKT